MNKLSVYGGRGFIGSNFCKMFSDDVVVMDRDDFSPKTKDILYLISTTDNYNVLDNNLHIDIDTNLTVLMNVLKTIIHKKDTTFNFVSSWFVYGKNFEIPFREDYSSCDPCGFYSITKYCAEKLLVSFCETNDIKYRIFRLGNVLGVGDNKISKKKNALQYLIREIVRGNDIPLYYGGEVLRDYIGVDDVCRGMKVCIENSQINQITNIGSGRPYRFLDLINMAIKYSNSKSKIIDIKSSKFHDVVQIRHSYLDTAKLISYGFEQEDSIEEIVKNLVDFYRKEIA